MNSVNCAVSITVLKLVTADCASVLKVTLKSVHFRHLLQERTSVFIRFTFSCEEQILHDPQSNNCTDLRLDKSKHVVILRKQTLLWITLNVAVRDCVVYFMFLLQATQRDSFCQLYSEIDFSVQTVAGNVVSLSKKFSSKRQMFFIQHTQADSHSHTYVTLRFVAMFTRAFFCHTSLLFILMLSSHLHLVYQLAFPLQIFRLKFCIPRICDALCVFCPLRHSSRPALRWSLSLRNGKGKFVTVHDVKAYSGSGSVAPLILNLNTRWNGWSASSSDRFNPGRKNPQ